MRLLILFALMLLAPLARAAEYHVTTTGSGSACTLANPCLTIQLGLAVAGASDTLWVHAGTYVEAISTDLYTITGGTSWATRLQIRAWPGDQVTLRPTSGVDVIRLATTAAKYIEIEGFDIDAVSVTGCVKISWTSVDTNASHHIRLRGNEMHNGLISDTPGASGSGVLITGPNSTFNELIGNYVHSNGGHGFYIATSDNLITDNEVTRNTQNGIISYLSGSSGVNRNRILYNRTHNNSVGSGSDESGILISSGEDTEVRGNRSWANDIGIRMYGGDPPGHTNPAVDTIVADNYTWSNPQGTIVVDAEATGTVQTNNSTTEPATNYVVTNNPYSGVDWGTILHCQAQGHQHAYDSAKITSLSNAGYCAATAMHYSGPYRKTGGGANNIIFWIDIGSPNPDPGEPIGWGEYRRWPPTSYGFPSLPLNSLKFYLPGAEDGGLFAAGGISEHFYALGLTTYMEGSGCTSCGWSGSAVRTHNPLGLPAGQVFSTNQEFINEATALGAMVIVNHPAGAPTTRDAWDPFPRAVEIWNGYHAYYDEESNAGNECAPSGVLPSTYISEFQAMWDHVLETKSARIWGVSVNDWTGPDLPTGNPSNDCYPNITTANRDRGKIDVLLPSYDLASYLDAFNRGAFFAVVENNATKSAYPLVTEVTVTETTIAIETAEMDEYITWTADGVVVASGFVVQLEDLPASLAYIRAEIDDGDGRVVFTQPFELTVQAIGTTLNPGTGLSGGRLQ